MRSVLFTDGAKHLADRAGAYWLIDEIALAQKYEGRCRRRLPALEADGQSRSDGDPRLRKRRLRTVIRKEIPFTDFPATGSQPLLHDNTILLPSEY